MIIMHRIYAFLTPMYCFEMSSCFCFRYSIAKLTDVFRLTLDMSLCLDDACHEIGVFNELDIPIPFCNTNFSSFQLPGDGTILGFAEYLGEKVGDAAVNMIIERLGLDVSTIRLV